MRKLLMLAIAAMLFLSACDDNSDPVQNYATEAGVGRVSAKMMAVGGVAPAPVMQDSAAIAPAAPPSSMVMDRSQLGARKIAETHSLQIETPYDQLQARYQRDFKKCAALGCQVLNSSITLESGGNISTRIDPAKLGAFLDFLADGPGKIMNHSVSADDYTMEYSDTETANANLIALRNRLATLLQTRAENVDDILRIEQELNRLQTQIDQNTARLKILSTMTQMATVNLSYSVEYRPAEVKPYELKNTWSRAVQKFLIGIDRVVQFVFAALPWIPVLAVGVWLGVWILRIAFRNVTIRLPWRKKP